MAHEVEKFVYRAEEGEPWHGLGESWTGYLNPRQVMEKCGLDWEVQKFPSFIVLDNNTPPVYTGQEALVRMTDRHILDMVTQDWNDVANVEAFEFFDEYCKEGDMHMSTAGSLQHGRIVFALAKINESFELFKGKDRIDSYLLFTNPHKYGWATSISMNAIRVVCMNTLKMSLTSTAKDKIVRVSHRKEFIAEDVKKTLGISKKKLQYYKELATFLASKKSSKTDIVEYFKKLFPVLSSKEDSKKKLSKAATRCLEVVDTQPGAEIAPGTWWNTYNAVSFYTDHIASRTADNRLSSAWYGTGATLKTKALKSAVEMAEAS
jgi:phage/plasmid-like protein (TIGR03299 family)